MFLNSVSYWAAGGLGTCKPLDGGDIRNETCYEKYKEKGCVKKTIDGVPSMCYTYIYPITDWGNRPEIASVVVVVGCIMLPVCHLIWLGVFKLRMLIFEKTYGSRVQQVKYLNTENRGAHLT